MKTLTPYHIISLRNSVLMSNSDNTSVEDMWKTLEYYGVNRKMLEKLHPSSETLSHIYFSIKKQKAYQ